MSQSQIDYSEETRKDLSSTLNLSPIWGVKWKNVEYVADGSLRQIKSKYIKAKINLKEAFASSVAPGQSYILKRIFITKWWRKWSYFRQWLTSIKIVTKYIKQSFFQW